MRRDFTYKSANIAGASDLTILAPIKKGLVPALDAVTYKSRVKRVLQLLHAGRTNSLEYDFSRTISDAVERVGKIHSIRIAILEPEDKLLLAVTFDGSWESYIRVIWQKVSRLLDLIFCNTEGYVLGWESSFDDWSAWLRSAQAETPFLYSPPGLTNTDTHYLQTLERALRVSEDAEASLIEMLKFSVPSAEKNAGSIAGYGEDLSLCPLPNGFGVDLDVANSLAVRQGLRSLLGLYRLNDLYLPGLGDGHVLLRATHELLPQFKDFLHDDLVQDPINAHYPDAVRWFLSDLDYVRLVPPRPGSQSSYVKSIAKDVQGGILSAYKNANVGCLLMVAFESSSQMVEFLEIFKPSDATVEDLKPNQVVQNIALTVEGLRMAGLSDDEIYEFPEEFVQGMERRNGVLGDLYVNHPRRWNLPAHNFDQGTAAKDASPDDAIARVELSSVHAVIQVRGFFKDGNSEGARTNLLQTLKGLLTGKSSGDIEKMRAVPLSLQWCHSMSAIGRGAEHFGFVEANSNPELEPGADIPYNNQVHLGEMLHGYPNAADHGVPFNGAKSQRAQDLLRHGSFLVLRKLRQDVEGLESVVNQGQEKKLSKEEVLAKLMGRWPAGSSDSAGGDLTGKPIGNDTTPPNNNFNYENDPDGSGCPFQAHVRRANPRMLQEIEDKSEGRRPARIVRRGLSYGEPVSCDADGVATNLSAERGLMFMAYNASIGEQFEVIQRWLSGGNSTGTYSGHSDPFLGVTQPGRRRVVKFLSQKGEPIQLQLDGSDDPHEEPHPLVRLEWGMYLFVPSVAALDRLKNSAGSKTSDRESFKTIEWSVARGDGAIAELCALQEREGEGPALLAWKEALEDPHAAMTFKTASIWAAVRHTHGGVLKTPYGVLVGSQEAAAPVLLNKNGNYTAQGYLPRMNSSFGELYLGLDAGRTDQRYEREAPEVNAAILELVDTPKKFNEAKAQAAKVTQDAIASFANFSKDHTDPPGSRWEATIDLRDLIEKVIANFCEEWFGLSAEGGFFQRGGVNWVDPLGSGLPRYPGHFMAPSRCVFQPHPSETVSQTASVHGKQLNAAMLKYLAASPKAIVGKSIVEAIKTQGSSIKDPDGYAARTLLGLMMGFVPTTDGLMRRIASEWLRENTLWTLRNLPANNETARQAAFRKALIEAFLLRAAPELLWRTAQQDHTLIAGAKSVRVKKGEVVVVGQISATHQGLESEDPSAYIYAFGDNRRTPTDPKPTHACPGRGPAMAVIEGFLEGLVSYATHSLRPGPNALTFVVEGRGQTDPVVVRKSLEHLVLERDGISVQARATTTQIFALGDSWVWQTEALKDKNFHNLVSALREHKDITFSFRASSKNFSNGLSNLFDILSLNYQGRKLSEILSTHDEDSLYTYGVWLEDRLVKLTKEKFEIDAFLLNAGGNDIARLPKNGSKSFRPRLHAMLVEGASSLANAFNSDKDKFLGELKTHYAAIFDYLQAKNLAPIFICGYDYPEPDGRQGVYGPHKSGPWLDPVLGSKGFRFPYPLAKDIMKKLINDMNVVIVDEANAANLRNGLPKVHYVKLTGTFSGQIDYSDPVSDIPPSGYKKYWANELHPTQEGFKLLAVKIVEAMQLAGVVKNGEG